MRSWKTLPASASYPRSPGRIPTFAGGWRLRSWARPSHFRSHWGGPLSTVQTDRMAARAPRDDLMLFCVQMGGRGHMCQHDRFAELPAGSGVLCEARSPVAGVHADGDPEPDLALLP